MRFRDFFCVALVTLIVVAISYGARSSIENAMFASVEINREDANRDSATLLTEKEWTEFQIPRQANSFRLLTNAALDAKDAPDHDLDNPRKGWQYALQYELLDSSRTLITKSKYHFRSQIRKLRDSDTGEPIYPIFFGKSSLVASQTRTMQLALDQSEHPVSILRVRIAAADPKIQEIVARVYTRSERENFDKRSTWNRLSQVRRTSLTKYCVYEHDLLTIQERTNLLRMQWSPSPTLKKFVNRYMFFVGDRDDQEIRSEQLPAGLYVDTTWQGTIPVPEGPGRLTLKYQWLDHDDETIPSRAAIDWFGASTSDRDSLVHESSQSTSESTLDVDGGLVTVQPSSRVVVNAFWKPTANTDVPTETLDVTPEMSHVRTYLSDSRPVEYTITHLDDQSTPLRLSIRYPHASLFSNHSVPAGDMPSIDAGTDAESQNTDAVALDWEFLDSDGHIVDSGTLSADPTPSILDRITISSTIERISDPTEFFFAVPPEVKRVRVRSEGCRLLVNGHVRPAHLPRVTQIPEDYHAFNRRTSINRTWFALKPIGSDDLVQENRSFIVQSQPRPPEPNEEVLAGRYEWNRFIPSGKWIGREVLIPKAIEQLSADNPVRETAIPVSFAEIVPKQLHQFRNHDSSEFSPWLSVSMAFVSDDNPGRVKIIVDGQTIWERRIASARGQIVLDGTKLGDRGTILVESENPARFFIAGKEIQAAPIYTKRTAQRLKDGLLDFAYDKKTADDELLTLLLLRGESDQERCKLRVTIHGPLGQTEPPVRSSMSANWTIRDRVYDLRPLDGYQSLLLGQDDRIDTGHRCYVKLGSDLAPGKYQIKIDRIDDVRDGYALLYSIVPGSRATRLISVSQAKGTKDGN